ncbi:MAG: hypothetical protein ACMXYC_03460 [Candidatus Woesearchaeota archaeon]
MKKAQFSFEFMLTYGWAFLIIFGIVAAIYGFGLLDFQRVAPKTECLIYGQQFLCQEALLQEHQVNMHMYNGFGHLIEIINISIEDMQGNVMCANTTSISLPSGAQQDISISGCTLRRNADVTLQPIITFRNPRVCDDCTRTALGILEGRVN